MSDAAVTAVAGGLSLLRSNLIVLFRPRMLEGASLNAFRSRPAAIDTCLEVPIRLAG